jgi:hypothetical protein
VSGHAAGPAQRYRCECDHEFQVFGLGRQRRFYELDGFGWTRPVLTDVCPHCQRALPPVRLDGPAP